MTLTLLDIAVEAVEKYGAMQKPTELAALLALVSDYQTEVVFEIGTATGGTLWALAAALDDPPLTLVSIDLPGGPFSGGATISITALRNLVWQVNTEARIHVIRGNSLTVELPDLQPDFVLIDGDHSADGVRADWERYAPLVKPGGLIALHDIVKHPEASGVNVEPVWNEIREREQTIEIIDPSTGELPWGGVGVVFR